METTQSQFWVLLYYCYTHIENPEQFRQEHHLFCIENNIFGRIIVAKEGLNGTVSGLPDDCQKYMATLKNDERFKHVEFKIDKHHEHTFTKIHVRVKDEIVHSSLSELHPELQEKGKYVEPAEFRAMKNDPNVVILDVRSNYEHHLGKFKNAITLDIENFREFPEKIHKLEHLKDKKIITYCTGGIKCEKASAFLVEKGFENVYQLHGGIIKYGLETDGEDFEGKCYVFDNRLSVDINKKNPVVLSKCHICDDACDRMINCANADCNTHIPVCEKCGWEIEGACSFECKAVSDKRVYDGTGYYQKATNGYNPYKGWKRKII
jgi:UPF0176 protein